MHLDHILGAGGVLAVLDVALDVLGAMQAVTDGLRKRFKSFQLKMVRKTYVDRVSSADAGDEGQEDQKSVHVVRFVSTTKLQLACKTF